MEPLSRCDKGGGEKGLYLTYQGKIMSTTSETSTSVTDQLRRAIAESELSRYEIARQSGIQQSALSRFLAGERGLWTVTLDRLFPVLGLTIVSTVPEKEDA